MPSPAIATRTSMAMPKYAIIAELTDDPDPHFTIVLI
jgi:hypothetical protein